MAHRTADFDRGSPGSHRRPLGRRPSHRPRTTGPASASAASRTTTARLSGRSDLGQGSLGEHGERATRALGANYVDERVDLLEGHVTGAPHGHDPTVRSRPTASGQLPARASSGTRRSRFSNGAYGSGATSTSARCSAVARSSTACMTARSFSQKPSGTGCSAARVKP